MIKNFRIGNKIINEKSQCFIVSELSANHNKSLKKCIDLIDQSKKIGVDAVKLQTFLPESLTLKSHRKKKIDNSPWKKYEDRYNLFSKASLPYSWHKKIFNYAKKNKILVFSSPFSPNDVKFLETVKCPAYKIASPEITDIPLLEAVSKTKKPIIISLGLAANIDIDLALRVLKKNKCTNYMLLKCTAQYPAKFDQLNLKSIIFLKKKYKCQIGFSDHTIGSIAPLCAVSLGAKMVEKHIKLNNEKKSLDSFFSTNVSDFAKMIKDIRNLEKCLGSHKYKLDRDSIKQLNTRKSLFIKVSLNKNQTLKEEHIACVRPFDGLHSMNLKKIIGKKLRQNVKEGSPVKLSYFY